MLCRLILLTTEVDHQFISYSQLCENQCYSHVYVCGELTFKLLRTSAKQGRFISISPKLSLAFRVMALNLQATTHANENRPTRKQRRYSTETKDIVRFETAK